MEAHVGRLTASLILMLILVLVFVLVLALALALAILGMLRMLVMLIIFVIPHILHPIGINEKSYPIDFIRYSITHFVIVTKHRLSDCCRSEECRQGQEMCRGLLPRLVA